LHTGRSQRPRPLMKRPIAGKSSTTKSRYSVNFTLAASFSGQLCAFSAYRNILLARDASLCEQKAQVLTITPFAIFSRV
jgi:hypothetical protein